MPKRKATTADKIRREFAHRRPRPAQSRVALSAAQAFNDLERTFVTHYRQQFNGGGLTKYAVKLPKYKQEQLHG